MPDIFISYKRENQPFAETLRESLLAWGHSVWMDVYDIPPGAHWPDAIDAGINSAHTVIGVLSPEAVQSRNVKNEWDWAIVNGRRLLLIMLEACTVPVNYVSINYIDATTEHVAALERLRAALDNPFDPPAARDDPYLPYLQSLYERINTMLAHAIIKLDDRKEPQPIDLVSTRTRGAVNELFEKRDEIDPFMRAMGIEDQQEEWETGDFHAAFDHFDGRVLLLGEPGVGKTITLLHFGRDAVVQRIQNPAAPLPILALIPTWDASKQPPLTEWIANSYGAPQNARQVIENGRALLLLDGLDELGSEREDPDTKERYDPRQRFITALAEMPENQIIVTCRVADYESIDAKIALSGAITLQALSDTQMQHYLDELPDLWAALQADAGVRVRSRTPPLGFFAFAYRDMTPEDAAKLRELVDSPGDLRDAIFERYVCVRYAHEKRKLQQRDEEMLFSLDEVVWVLGAVAMRNAVSRVKFEENILPRWYFDLALKETAQQDYALDFIELVVRLNLLAKNGNYSWRFVHLLLRDYFGFNHAWHRVCNEYPFVRGIAAYALGKIGDVRAITPLINALADAEDNVRRLASNMLIRIGTPAIAPLINAFADANLDERYNAVETLIGIRPPAVAPLINALADANLNVQRNAAKALTRIGMPEALDAVVPWHMNNLSTGDEQSQKHAAKFLARIGTPEALAVVIPWHMNNLSTGDEQSQKHAAKFLARIGTPEALAAVVSWHINNLSTGDEQSQRHAVEFLTRIGTPEALAAVVSWHINRLFIGSKWLQRHAANALTRIGTPEALAAVEEWRAAQQSDDA